jgi:hypothetical protein
MSNGFGEYFLKGVSRRDLPLLGVTPDLTTAPQGAPRKQEELRFAQKHLFAKLCASWCDLGQLVAVRRVQPRLQARESPENFWARFSANNRVLPRLGAVSRG